MDKWASSNELIGRDTLNSIRLDLEGKLNKCGLMYRVFARCKTTRSLAHKLERKRGNYSPTGKKVQDILGFRIVFYFISDVRIICEVLQKESLYNSVSDSEQEFKQLKGTCSKCDKNPNIQFDEIFRPERLNLVFKMDAKTRSRFRSELTSLPEDVSNLIDDTYEVQLRSVLSEGWHEVEHDLRYKCKDEWKEFELESRMLNGIFASIESHEYSMEMLFEKKARLHYNKRQWEPMLRNHLRMRIYDNLSNKIIDVLNADSKKSKAFLKFDREAIITALYQFPASYPLHFDNIIFFVNRLLENPIDEISELEPQLIKEKLDALFRTPA